MPCPISRVLHFNLFRKTGRCNVRHQVPSQCQGSQSRRRNLEDYNNIAKYALGSDSWCLIADELLFFVRRASNCVSNAYTQQIVADISFGILNIVLGNWAATRLRCCTSHCYEYQIWRSQIYKMGVFVHIFPSTPSIRRLCTLRFTYSHARRPLFSSPL